MLSLYDRLYRVARRSGTPALQVYNFCRRLEQELEPHWSVLDPKAVEGLVVDLYDPRLSVSENISNILGALGLYFKGGWSDDYEAWIELRQLEEAVEEGLLELVEVSGEIARLRSRLERLWSKSRQSRARRGRRGSRSGGRLRLVREYRVEGIELRPYQRDALDRWLARGCRGVIVMPTGAGKTFVALAAIRELKARTLIVVPTIALLGQWLDRLCRYRTLPARPRAYYGGCREAGALTVTTYQSLSRRPDLIDGFELIVFDECHHLAAKTWSRVLERLRGRRVMGLTATPFRFDGREHLFLKALGGIAYSAPLRRLRGYLAPLRVIGVEVDLTKSERLRYSRMSCALSRVAALAAGERDECEREVHLMAMLSLLARIKALLAECEGKVERAAEICGSVDDRVLVFSESVRSVERLAVRLGEVGVSYGFYRYGRRDDLGGAVGIECCYRLGLWGRALTFPSVLRL